MPQTKEHFKLSELLTSGKARGEMEMVTVKHEENVDGRVVDSQVMKHDKRRLRGLISLQRQPGKQISSSVTVRRSSKFRGVSRHRWTGRYEAHLWDKLSWNVVQKKKGKQVYLGAYDEEESAARAYDLAAIKYWGASTFTNFPTSEYKNELEIMQNMTNVEYLASLRRRSSGFSRGVSKYRGVARHHHSGRWEARIGRVPGNKYLYLGTYGTQEEAARAYDLAAIEHRGINAVTNFDLSTYIRWLKPETVNQFITPEQSVPSGEPKMPPITPCFSNPTESPLRLHSLLFHPGYLSSGNLLDTKATPVNLLDKPLLPSPPLLSCSSSSSPSSTALGLLLRSSVFRDLMEKNTKIPSEDEDNEMEDKDQLTGNREDDGYICEDGLQLGGRDFQFIF